MIQKRTELPEVFTSFAEARQNGFLAMKKIKDSGKGVVGQFCTYTPLEIFMAADLVSVGLCSTSDETIPDAEKVLPGNLCPLIKSSYGFAITDKCAHSDRHRRSGFEGDRGEGRKSIVLSDE